MNYYLRVIAPAAYFYNVNVTSAIHGADPAAESTLQSAPWTALQTNTAALFKPPVSLSSHVFSICNMITVIFTGAKMYNSYLFLILIRLM